jgi:zinc transport system ATP-binding protein
MPEEVIRVDDLTFCYNGTAVIRDIFLTVKRGDYLGIAGSNGSGKSTLIKNILNILRPSKGTIHLFGQPLSAFNQWHKIGYLPQRINALNYHFPGTVNEIIQLGKPQNNPADVKNVLGLMGIVHLSEKLISELSYGEQQRVMLASTLIKKPELLIFDEPTTALDPETRDTFYSLTGEMNLQGTTVVLITHDTGIIGKYARHLLYLEKKVIFSGTFKDFCVSPDMTGFFGLDSQHMICHQHDKEGNKHHGIE